MPSEYTIAIVGSRDGVNREAVEEFVARLNPVTTVVISGGARGTDTWAVEAAQARGIRTRVYPAQWEKYGRGAGFRRNKLLVALADGVVAFWNGHSNGTRHTMQCAVKARKPLSVFSGPGTLIRYIDENGEVYEQVEHPDDPEAGQNSQASVHPEA